MEAQALGSWQTLEMTITGREMAYNNNQHQPSKQQKYIYHNKKHNYKIDIIVYEQHLHASD